ncbi:hypothetical protein V8C42DRAFT_353917 [Trichoderma barbatum]
MGGLETYAELPDSRSIRVIKLHGSANHNDDVRFDLITVPLHSLLPYEAISYTWPSQALNRPVYANGQEYFVTRNAEDIMRRLCPNKPEQSRNLRIDAILQVQLMFEVYANADHVNVWLGQGTELNCARSQVAEMARFAGAITSADSTFIRLLLWITVTCMSCVCASIVVFIGAVVLLPCGLLPVFNSRQPSIQKANANKLCFILCGSPVPLRLYLSYLSHYMVPYICTSCPLNSNIFYTNLRAEFGNQIVDVLWKTKATMAKDKPFAIRAIFPDSLGALTVDYYSVSDSDVYTEAAGMVLQETQNVQFFRYACQYGGEDRFPTWVSPWTALVEIPEWLYGIIVEGAGTKALRLKGRRVYRATSAITGRFPIIASLQSPWSRSSDLDIAYEAFVVFGEQLHATGGANIEDHLLYQLAQLISDMTKLDAGEALAWLHSIWSENKFGTEFLHLVSGRSLFATESGKVGMSTLVIRVEDEITLRTGEKLPYTIRKIAPCWLSGALLDGEWPDWNGQLEDLEDIELI